MMADSLPGHVNALFVYGTLMPASGHAMAKRLQGQSVYLGPGWIPGRLYSFGRYPGAVRSRAPGEGIHGDAVRLRNPSASLAWIDVYEGCGQRQPEPHAYERVIVPVTLNSGELLNAWVYFYKLPIGCARYLPDGRFLP